MTEPQITTESVKYTLDGSSVVAQRRDLAGPEGVQTQWVFNLPSTLAAQGVPLASAAYAEKVANTEDERDQIGNDLVSLISEYRGGLAEVQREFQEALAEFFPAPGAPVVQGGPVPA